MTNKKPSKEIESISLIGKLTDLNNIFLQILNKSLIARTRCKISIESLRAGEFALVLITIALNRGILVIYLFSTLAIILIDFISTNSNILQRWFSGKSKVDSLLEKMDRRDISAHEFKLCLLRLKYDAEDLNKILEKAIEKNLMNADFQSTIVYNLQFKMDNFEFLFGKKPVKLLPELVSDILWIYRDQLNKEQIKTVYGLYTDNRDVIEGLLNYQEEAYPLLKDKIDNDIVLTYKATKGYEKTPHLWTDLLINHGRPDGWLTLFLVNSLILALLLWSIITISSPQNLDPAESLSIFVASLMLTVFFSLILVANPIKRRIQQYGFSRKNLKIMGIKENYEK